MASPWNRNYTKYRNYFINSLAHYRDRDDVKAYLELILTSFSIVILSLFALKPTLTTIGTLTKEIESKENTVTTLDSKISKLQTAQKLLKDQRSSIDNLNQAIPDFLSIDSLVRQLEGVTEDSGVYVNIISMSGGQIYSRTQPVSSGVSEVGFDLNLVGEYQQVVDFLRRIEDVRRPIAIESLKIEITQEQVGLLSGLFRMKSPYISGL